MLEPFLQDALLTQIELLPVYGRQCGHHDRRLARAGGREYVVAETGVDLVRLLVIDVPARLERLGFGSRVESRLKILHLEQPSVRGVAETVDDTEEDEREACNGER